jgi:predicted transcriptional regulator
MNNKKQSTKEFSERLKHVIAALGTTGREFSKRAGIGYSTVHNYMHGSSSPTLDNLVPWQKQAMYLLNGWLQASNRA